MFRPLIKRLSHNHSRSILNKQTFQIGGNHGASFVKADNLVEEPNGEQRELFKGAYLHKPTNAIIQCESKSKSNTSSAKDTKIYIDDKHLIHSQDKLLPIKIHYFDKNTICKITVEIINC